MSGRRWTEEEIDRLRWLAEREFSVTSCAEQIGRSPSSVYLKAALLGLKMARSRKYYPLTDISTWDEADRICAFANVPLPLARLVVRKSHEHNLAAKTVRSQARLPDYLKCRADIVKEAIALGYSMSAIGRALSRDHSTIWHTLKVHNSSTENDISVDRRMGAAREDSRIAA